MRILVGSDNQGNVFSLLNQASERPHTAALLMELVLTIHAAGCSLACHVPRELNEWADELTHPLYGGPVGTNHRGQDKLAPTTDRTQKGGSGLVPVFAAGHSFRIYIHDVYNVLCCIVLCCVVLYCNVASCNVMQRNVMKRNVTKGSAM